MSTADTMDSLLRPSSPSPSRRTDSLEQRSSPSPLQSPRQGPVRHRPVQDSAAAAPEAQGVVGGRPRSASSAKALLTLALLEAQSAVQMDNDGLVGGAVESYSKAVGLLSKVMEATSAPEERERLKIIHDSYRFRMLLLATPKPQGEQGQDADEEDEDKGMSSQDFPSSVQPSPPMPAHDRSALPRTPISPPPELPRSPPPMAPRSPPPNRLPRSLPLGPQAPRSPPLSASNNPPSSNNFSGVAQLNDRPASPRDPSPRRAKKQPVASQGPLSPLSPLEPRTRRPRAESASASEGLNEDGMNGQGRGRYRTRTLTEGTAIYEAESDSFSPTEQQNQQRRTAGRQPKVREREALPKVVILRTPPTTPLPPPPQRQNGVASEPVPTITSLTQGSPATMVSAPAPVLSPGTSSESPPVPAVPPIPAALSQRIERSRAASPPPRATSPPQRPPRPSSPSLAAVHMIMASLAGPDPGRPLSPPPSIPLPISPTLSPTSPSRRMRPLIPAGLHYKQFDIQDLIPNRDHSLPPPLEKQATAQEQTWDQEQGEEQSAEKTGDGEQTGEGQVDEGQTGVDSAAFSESPSDNKAAAIDETEEADEGGEIGNPEGTPEELVQEWLPNLLSKSFATSKIFLDHLEVPAEPAPRERVFIKGWYNPAQNQNEPTPPFNISSTIPEGGESTSKSTPIILPALRSSSGVTSPIRQQPQASSSSTSLDSSLSSSSSTRTRISLSMPISGTGGETKGRSSGSSQPRGSQEMSSPTDNQRNYLLQLNNAQLAMGMAYSSKLSVHQSVKANGGGNSSAPKEVTVQDIIAQDPFASMKSPLSNPKIAPAPADPFLRCFWFMHLLEQTMTSGGFLSPKLYVPKVIWYQKTLIRLPAIDAKINACQTVSQVLERMTAKSKNGKLNLIVHLGKDVDKAERERNRVLKELEMIEEATQEQWTKLSKKMSFINRPGKISTTSGGIGWGGVNGSSMGNNGSSMSTNGQYHHQRPPQHYEYQNPHYQPQQRPLHHYQSQDEPVSGPYDWIGSDDPFATMASGSLTSGTLSSGVLSSGVLSSGTLSTGLLTSSNLTSSSMSDKGTSTGGSSKRTTADLKNQWKSFSKSVQKSIINEKVEDTTDYAEALIQLFQSSFILESMLQHFESLPPHQTHIKILKRLQRICDFYNMVVCAFVVRDLGELMVKYVKRMGTIVAE